VDFEPNLKNTLKEFFAPRYSLNIE